MEHSLITQLGADEFVSDITNYFNPERFIPRVIAFLVILAIAIALTRLVRKSFKKLQSMRKISSIFGTLMRKVLNAIIWVVAAVFILQDFGVDLTPVIAGLGISGVVLGFALQESIASLFSGIMIAINNPFRVGDWVDIGDVSGTVTSMDIMCVTLTSGDNKKITMNNKNVWGSTIVNYSYIDKRRLDMTVSVDYSTDTDKAKNIIRALIMSYPEILPDPAPVVEVNNYGASSIDIIVRPYVLPSDYWNVYWRFNAEVLKTLRANGMDMPFNQLVVHLDSGDKN